MAMVEPHTDWLPGATSSNSRIQSLAKRQSHNSARQHICHSVEFDQTLFKSTQLSPTYTRSDLSVDHSNLFQHCPSALRSNRVGQQHQQILGEVADLGPVTPLSLSYSSTSATKTRSPSHEPVQQPAGRPPTVSQQEWAKYKDEIACLWLKEKKSLSQVIDIMQDRHEFWASPKMYKTQFSKWKMRKKLPTATLAQMKDIADYRKLEGKDTEFHFRDQKFNSATVQKRLDRRKKSCPAEPVSVQSPPQNVRCDTPNGACMPALAVAQSAMPRIAPALQKTCDTSTSEASVSCIPISQEMRTEPNVDHHGLMQLSPLSQFVYTDGLETMDQSSDCFIGIDETAPIEAQESALSYVCGGSETYSELVLDQIALNYISCLGVSHPSTTKHVLQTMDVLEGWSCHQERRAYKSRILEVLEYSHGLGV